MATSAADAAFPVDDAAAAVFNPRSELFVTGEDHLHIMSVNSLTGAVVTIYGRLWDPTRRVIVPFSRTHIPANDRTIREDIIPLAAGFVLDLTVRATSGAPLAGQTFVMVELVRGLTSIAALVGTLAAGYVTSTQCVCWPGDTVMSSTEGEPFVRVVAGTTPAAGNDISETVPTGARWQLLAFRAVLTTSAAAGTRSPQMKINAPGGTPQIAICIPAAGVAAGAFIGTTWGPNLPLATLSARTQQAFPDPTILPAGSEFGTNSVGLDVGDQWSNVSYLVREWLEVP